MASYRCDAACGDQGYEPELGVRAEGYFCRALPDRDKQNVALWSANAEEFRPERWSGGDNGAAMESNYGFLSFLEGSRGFMGNVLAKVEFRCLLAVMIGRFEFE